MLVDKSAHSSRAFRQLAMSRENLKERLRTMKKTHDYTLFGDAAVLVAEHYGITVTEAIEIIKNSIDLFDQDDQKELEELYNQYLDKKCEEDSGDSGVHLLDDDCGCEWRSEKDYCNAKVQKNRRVNIPAKICKEFGVSETNYWGFSVVHIEDNIWKLVYNTEKTGGHVLPVKRGYTGSPDSQYPVYYFTVPKWYKIEDMTYGCVPPKSFGFIVFEDGSLEIEAEAED